MIFFGKKSENRYIVKIEIDGRNNLSDCINDILFNSSPVNYPDAAINKNIENKNFEQKSIER
jgi:hypothetical protein